MKDLEDGLKSFVEPQSDMDRIIQSAFTRAKMEYWEQLHVSTEEEELRSAKKTPRKMLMIGVNKFL